MTVLEDYTYVTPTDVEVKLGLPLESLTNASDFRERADLLDLQAVFYKHPEVQAVAGDEAGVRDWLEDVMTQILPTRSKLRLCIGYNDLMREINFPWEDHDTLIGYYLLDSAQLLDNPEPELGESDSK